MRCSAKCCASGPRQGQNGIQPAKSKAVRQDPIKPALPRRACDKIYCTVRIRGQKSGRGGNEPLLKGQEAANQFNRASRANQMAVQ